MLPSVISLSRCSRELLLMMLMTMMMTIPPCMPFCFSGNSIIITAKRSINKLPSRNHHPRRRSSSWNMSSDEAAEDDLPESLMAQLNARISETRNKAVARDSRIARNWRNGNWSVRGFALDKTDAKEDIRDLAAGWSSRGTTATTRTDTDVDDGIGFVDGDERQLFSGLPMEDGSRNNENDLGSSSGVSNNRSMPIHACKLSLGPDIGFGIAVGRTDGSVCVVKIGGEYLAKFSSVARMKMENSGGDNDAVADMMSTVKLSSELVREDSLYSNSIPAPVDGSFVPNADDNMDYTSTDRFEVVSQFSAHDGAITALLFDSIRTMYTCGRGDFQIKEWSIPGSLPINASDEKCVRVLFLHTDEIVALKTMYSAILESDLLVSFSKDGTFAIWEKWTGDLVYRVSVASEYGEVVPILCADVEEQEGIIFVGTAAGDVFAYTISDIVDAAEKVDQQPEAICRFAAYKQNIGAAVTTLHLLRDEVAFSNLSQRANASQNLYSCTLLTGSDDGLVKQWEIIGRKQPKEDEGTQPFVGKLQHWPRLQNQTLKNRAHVFQGHLGEVTDIVGDSSKILSCSLDGSIRLWSPSSGTCLYTMDGFENISSLCLEESLLVTDGMGQYVCVHDFDTIEDIDQTYDLDFGV
uniref:Uncharacterized protein n=1 Tax=Leptocylindrus danicus TaxID=163516 RepID=A0A7S2L7E3_9STRA|mmetsp:Transcript_32933/g.47681  ORF Transcript_32933/g.47681 Transcript_32933/m.47681 type:complete len:637 (+) Transcript_32933:199-2109(+)